MATQSLSREADGPSRPSASYAFVPVFVNKLTGGHDQVSDEGVKVTFCLVCKVLTMRDSGSSIDFLLADHSGQVRARAYKNKAGVSHAVQDFVYREGDYASVIGSVTVVEQETLLVVNRIRNVTAYKEVDLHRTQVVWAMLVKNHVLKTVERREGRMEVERKEAKYDSMPEEQVQIMRVVEGNNGGVNVGVDLIKKRVRMNPHNVEVMLKALVQNGYLQEDNDYTVFSVI
jgi:hypothetical protein